MRRMPSLKLTTAHSLPFSHFYRVFGTVRSKFCSLMAEGGDIGRVINVSAYNPIVSSRGGSLVIAFRTAKGLIEEVHIGSMQGSSRLRSFLECAQARHAGEADIPRVR